MSERDRQNPYDRDPQFGSGNRGSAGQTSQWQGDTHRQQGGDWQQDGQRGGSDDYTRDYRFSGQGSSHDDAQGYGRGDSQDYGRQDQRSFGGTNRSQLNDDSLRNDQRDASRNYNQARGYGQHNDRGQQDWQRNASQENYGQRSSASGYAGRDYDASGGNDFGNFTSEDFGGRDFSNRNGGAMGGMRSSESYRPSYGLSSWLRGNDDRDGRLGQSGDNRDGSNREDYGSWRQYGESRGFLQRAGDEVASWFGDEDASRRREQDHRQDHRSGGSHSEAQSHRGRGPSSYTRSDDRIREDANDHLTHDHHVDATHINVSVKDGELTLDGTVDSREAKRRAEDAVEHISGVKHVQNNLRVQDRTTSSLSTASSNGATTGAGSSYGQSSGLAGQGSGSSLGGTSATSGTSGTSSGASGSSTTGSGQSAGTTGASTTSGIGSTAAAGAGAASAPRSSDKPS
jgi:osmotically-inducible protein OsmY